jgi:hypothetical protein
LSTADHFSADQPLRWQTACGAIRIGGASARRRSSIHSIVSKSRIYFPESTPAGTGFRDQFEKNVAPYADLIEVHAGDVLEHEWKNGPIEILFIDMAKHWKVCDWVTRQFFPHLIPGRSLVVQQDYLYSRWVAWLHVTMEFYADYFEYVCDTEVNSVVFLCEKKIPESVLRRNTVESLTFDEKMALIDRAANRFDGAKREMILAAKAQFVEMLRGDGGTMP